jgi:thiamine-phosphate pyrophosphorylase
MISNETVCSTWRLYVILDRAAAGGRDLAELARAAIRGGADVLQLRDKCAADDEFLRQAERVQAVAGRAGIPLIINDRIAIARSSGAAGVHLGQDDPPLAEARRALGPGAILGKSTHSLAQAVSAEREGADYIGCGPVYATPTKPAYEPVGLRLVSGVSRAVGVPVVCIGGIDETRLPDVLAAGGTRIAVVRAVCAAADPAEAARALKTMLVRVSREHGRTDRGSRS